MKDANRQRVDQTKDLFQSSHQNFIGSQKHVRREEPMTNGKYDRVESLRMDTHGLLESLRSLSSLVAESTPDEVSQEVRRLSSHTRITKTSSFAFPPTSGDSSSN
jgi:hypothetical protein